jgi:carbamoyl-phosphate synthase large subunit
MIPRILIAGSGNITGLNIARALDSRHFVFAGYDFTSHNPTNMFCRNYVVPKCADVTYGSNVLDLVKSFGATVIIASNDHDVRALTRLHPELTILGVHVNAINDFTLTWLDKQKTSDFFLRNAISTPKQSHTKFPLVVRKSRVGEGKKFMKVIKTFDELQKLDDFNLEECTLTEFIEGPEYTVDIFCDADSNPIVVVPRRRHEVRAGIVHFGEVEKNELVIESTKQLAKKAKLTGINCAQCIQRGSECFFFEINPRPGSGLDLTTASGVNMPMLLINSLIGKNLGAQTPDWGLKMVRYHDGYFFK